MNLFSNSPLPLFSCQVNNLSNPTQKCFNPISVFFTPFQCILPPFQCVLPPGEFYLQSFLLVYAQAVHQPQHLLVVLAQGLVLLPCWVQDWPLGRHLHQHPLVLLDLSNAQTFGGVQDQHPPDQVLTLCWQEGKKKELEICSVTWAAAQLKTQSIKTEKNPKFFMASSAIPTSWFIPGFIQWIYYHHCYLLTWNKGSWTFPPALSASGWAGWVHQRAELHTPAHRAPPPCSVGEKKRIFSSVPSSQQGLWRCKPSPATERIPSCRKRGLRWKGGSCTLGGSWELNPNFSWEFGTLRQSEKLWLIFSI